ncbi:MAG: hypothetical protein K1X88_06115 [Nannocystaceae bacterium]|nr:hypothetical protein [Nannocystaceae bacterium]
MLDRVARIATVVLTVAYPLLVWAGLSRGNVRATAVTLVGVGGALLLLRARGRGWRDVGALARPLLPTLVAAAATGLTGDPALLLWAPVVVNLGLLAGFGATLRPGRVPMIERFARLQHPELSARARRWCRGVTTLWLGFFAANAVASAVLAAAAPLSWWAAYCGGGVYGLIGLLLVGERVLRPRHDGGDDA